MQEKKRNGKTIHTTEEILAIMAEVNNGSDVKDVCKKYGISTYTYYLWCEKFQSSVTASTAPLKKFSKRKSRSTTKEKKQVPSQESKDQYELAGQRAIKTFSKEQKQMILNSLVAKSMSVKDVLKHYRLTEKILDQWKGEAAEGIIISETITTKRRFVAVKEYFSYDFQKSFDNLKNKIDELEKQAVELYNSQQNFNHGN